MAYACPNCAGIAFCSVECQKVACSTYHAYECKFMDMMIGSGMSILCFIALRIVTQYASVEMAIQKGRQIIHELCTHSSERKATDYLQRTVMSAFLLRIMQKSQFFGRRTSESGKFFESLFFFKHIISIFLNNKRYRICLTKINILYKKPIRIVSRSLKSVEFLLDYYRRFNSMPMKFMKQKHSKGKRMSVAKIYYMLEQLFTIRPLISIIAVVRMLFDILLVQRLFCVHRIR